MILRQGDCLEILKEISDGSVLDFTIGSGRLALLA